MTLICEGAHLPVLGNPRDFWMKNSIDRDESHSVDAEADHSYPSLEVAPRNLLDFARPLHMPAEGAAAAPCQTRGAPEAVAAT